jgi:hypothetical protein
MLANADEPLILADGTKIDPSSGKVVREKKYGSMIAIPAPSEAQDIVARTRRGVQDMPVPPQQMNGISLVCFYAMWGLNKQDIAIQLNITVSQVENIQKLPEYKKLREDLFKSVMETEANDVRGILQQKARDAATKIIDTMDEEGALGFAAAKDILDRGGHRPADVVEHRHSLDNALQIEFIQKAPVDHIVPVIDAEFEEVN